MLVVVNQPHTDKEDFRIVGNISSSMIDFISKEYGKENINMKNDDGEELLNPFEMDWFKEIEAKETPGGNIKFYRKLLNMTQVQLAEKLGTTKQIVSMMENNKRPISKNTAIILSNIFRTSVASFIF